MCIIYQIKQNRIKGFGHNQSCLNIQGFPKDGTFPVFKFGAKGKPCKEVKSNISSAQIFEIP